MTLDDRQMNVVFDKLRSRVAAGRESFPQELEDRLMKEFTKQTTGVRRRPLVWAAAITFLVLSFGSGAVASSRLREWFFPGTIRMDEDGLIRNNQGEVIGATVENENGTFQATIALDESSQFVVEGEGPAPAGEFSLSVEAEDQSVPFSTDRKE